MLRFDLRRPLSGALPGERKHLEGGTEAKERLSAGVSEPASQPSGSHWRRPAGLLIDDDHSQKRRPQKGAIMAGNLGKQTAQEPLARKGKRPPRGARIHRRRLLALQRRAEKTEAVTSSN